MTSRNNVEVPKNLAGGALHHDIVAKANKNFQLILKKTRKIRLRTETLVKKKNHKIFKLLSKKF